MPSLVGAASPGRRKLASPERRLIDRQCFWSVFGFLSVLGALSALLGCGMINTSCCLAVDGVRVRGVWGFFVVFPYRFGGSIFFYHQKTLRYGSKRPGASFLPLQNHSAPGGAFTRVITVHSL